MDEKRGTGPSEGAAARELGFSRLNAALPPTVPFVPPEALERRIGRRLVLRLGANESAFGPSPRAVAAMTEAARQASWYNDPEGHDLREALARRHGVRRDNVALGSGIDDLLGLLVRCTVDAGDAVVMSEGAYPTFAFHVRGYGGRLVTPPYRDDRNDPEALAAEARRAGARLVFLANPDNPTGSWLDRDTVLRLAAALPAGSRLVLDEAYAEFAPPQAIPELDPEDPRVVRMRTFSKAFGLAGARIGYALVSAATNAAFDKMRNHFGVNRLAQAGALAALDDGAFVADVVREVAEGRADYARLARELGLQALPSATNFVAIDMGSFARARATLDRLLVEEGVFIRMPGAAPLNRCIRVTVGTRREREAFAAALTRVVRSAAA